MWSIKQNNLSYHDIHIMIVLVELFGYCFDDVFFRNGVRDDGPMTDFCVEEIHIEFEHLYFSKTENL